MLRPRVRGKTGIANCVHSVDAMLGRSDSAVPQASVPPGDIERGMAFALPD
jgi:hypothetical protein